MRKLIAGINMTLDGYCDHTAVNPDDQIHWHYNEVLKNADAVLYGRITYQLMEYWPTVIENPTGIKAIDEFAVTIDNIEKVVFSRTLKSVTWRNSRLATRSLEDEVKYLKQQPGREILVGSPSLIISLMKLNLVDEYQFCVHPIVVGKGMPLFKNIEDKIMLKLLRTKIFDSGAVIFYYERQS